MLMQNRDYTIDEFFHNKRATNYTLIIDRMLHDMQRNKRNMKKLINRDLIHFMR